jgi:hypothetical protein
VSTYLIAGAGAEVDEQVRWFGVVPTEDEGERIARGETVTFLANA